MADRFKFAEVRQEVIEMLKKDLLGPSSENEILNQNPRFEYIVGMLAPQTSENDSNEQEIDGDASFEGDADYTAGEDDDNEPVFTNRFKTPSSIGISFYLESSTKSFNVDVTWGDYTKASDKTTNKEGKEVDVSTYKRHPQKETVVIDLQEFSKNKEYPLVCDSNVILYVSKIGLKQGYTFLDDAEKRTEYYSESDRNKLSGFLFRINLNDKYFWVYQHIYSVSRIDRSKNVIALFVGDTYDEIDSDIVQIDSRADVIIFSSSVVTAKMDLMQRFFGFEQYIRAGAQKTIEIIRDLDIVDSLEKFVAFENKSKLTNAKKLLKAKNSPVLQMKKNDLLENLKKHSRYKTMFKFEEDHIVISSQKEAAAFIKMLNDDIVRSELTGKEYDSSSKMLLGPVGASH